MNLTGAATGVTRDVCSWTLSQLAAVAGAVDNARRVSVIQTRRRHETAARPAGNQLSPLAAAKRSATKVTSSWIPPAPPTSATRAPSTKTAAGVTGRQHLGMIGMVNFSPRPMTLLTKTSPSGRRKAPGRRQGFDDDVRDRHYRRRWPLGTRRRRRRLRGADRQTVERRRLGTTLATTAWPQAPGWWRYWTGQRLWPGRRLRTRPTTSVCAGGATGAASAPRPMTAPPEWRDLCRRRHGQCRRRGGGRGDTRRTRIVGGGLRGLLRRRRRFAAGSIK